MLKKTPNDISVSKLWAILLLEENFNVANKIIFNTYMIPQIERQNETSREIIGRMYLQYTIHRVMNKKLIADISN